MLCVHSRMWCGDETMMMKNCLHTAAVQRPYSRTQYNPKEKLRATFLRVAKSLKFSQNSEFSQPQHKTKLKTLTQHITTH